MEEAASLRPVNNIREVFEDPQVQHLEMAMPIRHRSRGDLRIVGGPLKIEGLETGVLPRRAGPGRAHAEILAEAGLSAEQIAKLRAKGALGGTCHAAAAALRTRPPLRRAHVQHRGSRSTRRRGESYTYALLPFVVAYGLAGLILCRLPAPERPARPAVRVAS